MPRLFKLAVAISPLFLGTGNLGHVSAKSYFSQCINVKYFIDVPKIQLFSTPCIVIGNNNGVSMAITISILAK